MEGYVMSNIKRKAGFANYIQRININNMQY